MKTAKYLIPLVALLVLSVTGCETNQQESARDVREAAEAPRTRDALPTGRLVDNKTRRGMTEAVVAQTQTSEMSAARSRSLSNFGACVAHYSREMRYIPAGLPAPDTWPEGLGSAIQVKDYFEDEASMWVPIGLCLEYAPRPAVDDVSGKCIVQGTGWFAEEWPEIAWYGPVVATIACLPGYSP